MTLVIYDSQSILSSLYQDSRVLSIGGLVNKDFVFYQKGSGTGGLVWPASELLSNYLAQEFVPLQQIRDINWAESKVLELGAGLGVVSTTLIHMGSTVIATDGMENVVQQLEENLILNSEKDHLRDHFTCSVLEWGDIDALKALKFMGSTDSGVDVIVASDVVYGEDRDVWGKLAHTLQVACHCREEYRERCFVRGQCEPAEEGTLPPFPPPKTLVLLAQVHPNLCVSICVCRMPRCSPIPLYSRDGGERGAYLQRIPI